jgi:hypothetical protein
MIGKTAGATVFIVGAAISLFAAAPGDQNPPGGQQPPASSAPQAPQAPKKQDLSGWWQKSAMAYQPLPEKWLFHADGTLSYMNASGNVSGSTLDVSGSAEVRKNRFTSHSFAQVSRKNVNYLTTQTVVNYTERTLREQVDFDVKPHITFLAGIEDYRNTLMFMDKRLNVYGGMGATLYRTDKHQLNLTGGIGHADFTFDRAQMLRVNPRAVGIDTSPTSGGAMGMQVWRWSVSPRFNFSEDASYMQYFESDLGHRWTINLNGNFPISKRFSFNLAYRVKEETNSIIKALRVFPEDRSFLMGIKVSI